MKDKTSKMELDCLIFHAALEAGKYLENNALRINELNWKTTDDPVTDLDKNAELIIKNILKKEIKANYYGEEFGIEQNDSEIDVYIDPIDGTKSFIRGEYLSSLSVSASKNGELFVGVVYDFMRRIAYYANSKTVHLISPFKKTDIPSIKIDFSKPTIAFGWNFESNNENDKLYYGRRQIGSIALSMAQLANGSYEGLIMRPYIKKSDTDVCDIAAGYYIMKQSGLIIKDYYGNKFNYKKPENGIIAYNPKIEKTIDKIMINEKPSL